MNGDGAAANQPASLLHNTAAGSNTELHSQDLPVQTPNPSAGSTGPVAQSSSATTGDGGANAAAVVGNEQVAIQDTDRGLASGTELGETDTAKEPQLEGLLPEQADGQADMMDQSSDVLVGSNDSGGNSHDDGHDWLPDNDHELKRVKVYELIGSRWVDQGTAFCFGQFQEETNEALLIARSESNYSEIILSTVIRSNDVYQRQQDTLIVWTEPDGVDYALSFQDPDGCSEVWNFILEVQRHMNGIDESPISSSPLIGPEPTSITTATIIRSGHLPQPQLGVIGEVERAIKALARTQAVKERICEYIQQEDYIKSLIEVFHQAEDLESLENLHALCSITQTILTLNDHGMYEHILEEDIFYGVVGMLEYDAEFPTHKANYREFLHKNTHFHQPIPIRDPLIQRKIHHTHRLQFLKDVVLARILDDSTFNVLNSCIIFNQIDIITHVQQDHEFLRDVVRLYVDEDMLSGGGVRKAAPQPPQQQQEMGLGMNGIANDKSDATEMKLDVKQLADDAGTKPANGIITPNGQASLTGTTVTSRSESYAFAPPEELTDEDIAYRREVILLIQQLCVMGKNVQLPARMALFRTLVDRGVLFGVQWALSLSEKDEVSTATISAGGEILAALLDHDLNGVRGHVLKQVVAIEKEREAGKKGADKAETILEMACRIMAQSRSLALQCQIGDALKVWMDIPTGDVAGPSAPPTTEAAHALAGGAAKNVPRKDDPGTERYMDYFYKHCINTLFNPFQDLPEWRNFTDPILPLPRERTNRYVYLCDLLYNFSLQHNFRSHFYIRVTNIVVRVATLLKARDKHLRHAAFRFFRLLLRQNNANIHTQIMKHDILKPILDLTLQESRRDNLLSCSCQEYFETMRRENMKEMINFCMTKHETEVRKLAQTPLGGQRFDLFIRRWEMNIEPLPEETKPEKPVDNRGWPGQGRALDAEEEDYFNADDDDDLIPAISSQRSRGRGVSSSMPMNTLKRKRRIAIGSSKSFRSQNITPLRTPLLGSLVDYDEDEEDLGIVDDDLLLQSLPSQTLQKSTFPLSTDISTSPLPSPRQISVPLLQGIPPKRASNDDDDEDNLLEALVRSRSRPSTPEPGMMAGVSMGLARPGEKRRRDDDDEEPLERLSKVKKPDFGTQKEGSTSRTKPGDDPPKKIKVKFGSTSLAVASPSASPTEKGAKDEDTG